MARRAGISTQLIVATAVVVAAAVGAATWLAQHTIAEVSDAQLAARRTAGEAAIARTSELIMRSVATTVALPLANSTYNDLRPVLDAAIAEDRASQDDRVQWLVVEDDAGAVVEATPGSPRGDELAKRERALAGRGVARAQLGATEWIYGTDVTLGRVVVGRLRIGVSTAGLAKELAAALADTAELARAARLRALIVSLGVLALGIAVAALHGARLARPIRQLTAAAERIAAGDLDGRVTEARRDELGTLARTFNQMADQIRRLLVEQADKASLEKELSLARQVQQAMLPPDTLDEHGALRVVGSCLPASSCGGDWWTYKKLAGDRLLIVIGDATGHGLHSAMIAATARGAVEAIAAVDERLLTPEQVLRAIDSGIRQVGDHNVLMTAFAAVLDAATGILSYANAGQNFPYVIGRGAAGALDRASIIAASGNPLGDRQIATEIRRGAQQLRPGDLFVCFTDGVVERANRAGKLFGDRRLRGALIGAALADGAGLVALRDRVLARLEAYADGADADDDITLVLCHFDPAPRAAAA